MQGLYVCISIYIYIIYTYETSYAQTSGKRTFALTPCLFSIICLDASTRSHMLSLQQKDGSFQGLTQLDILEHTAEISLELICLNRNNDINTQCRYTASIFSEEMSCECFLRTWWQLQNMVYHGAKNYGHDSQSIHKDNFDISTLKDSNFEG